MNSYLVHIILPEVFNAKFYGLIPKQREVVNDLLLKRVILSYSLDMERKNVWAFIAANSEREVMDVLSTFPIIKYIKISIHELAFYDTANLVLPDLIMN
jgi:hypothetical protein